jgi:hypothetical protein
MPWGYELLRTTEFPAQSTEGTILSGMTCDLHEKYSRGDGHPNKGRLRAEALIPGSAFRVAKGE